jgi:competence protein ComEA
VDEPRTNPTPGPSPAKGAEQGRTPPPPAGEGAGGWGPGDTPRSAQVALAVALVLLLGLLVFRGYGNGLRARPAEPLLAAGPVDLNTAEPVELEQVPGVGPARARAIVAARAAAPLGGPDDIRRIPGFGPATVEQVRPFVRADDVDPPLEERKRPTTTQPARGGKLRPGDPPVNVNAASEDELQRIPGVGPVTARAIAAARPFRTVDDLDRVKGIGPKTLEKLRPFVAVGPGTPQ